MEKTGQKTGKKQEKFRIVFQNLHYRGLHGRSSAANWYTGLRNRRSRSVIEEVEFRKAADAAIEGLKQELYAAEDDGEFEVEEQGGALYVVFEEPAGKFVITPNAPVQQIWISALSTSFKLDLTPQGFVLPKTGETLSPLVKRLIQEHAG